MWHVSNEYGDELSRCWCPESARHFRRWLRDRYGSLTELNRAWGTACWGQHYVEWDHIEVPRATTGPGNPAQLLDFERFSSDAFLALFDAEIAVLREITPDVPITTNFMGTFRQLDYWRFAGREDIVSNDAYPDPADPDSSRTAALGCSLMRSLKDGRPWLLMEQAPSAVSWRPVNVPKPPGLMRLHSMQALAHGADGVLFFQWRASRVGAERFHSAMVGHRGAVGRTWTECKDLGRELASLAELNGSRVRARVALMIDWDCWWALDPAGSLPSTRLDWLQQLREYHAALFDLGVCADLVPPDGDTSRYDAIIVPNWFLVKDPDAQRMSAYVRNGGHVLVGPFGGVVDECAQVHLGGGPGPLRELLGIAVDEYWPLADDASVAVDLPGAEPTAARAWTEVLECTSAEPIGWYRGGSADGHPALTRKRTGRGSARYLGAVLEPGGLRHVMAGLLADAGIPAHYDGERTLEVVTRTGPRADYTFVLNHREQPARYELTSPARELLTAAEVDTALRLPPFGVAILKRARPDHAGANQNQLGDR
jgi:beta-galactosidase